MHNPLLSLRPAGLYCAAGDFYIDPVRPVERAITTHAHSDHARRGSREYICVPSSTGLLKVRLGPGISVRGIPYGEQFRLRDALVSFHSAGHVLGSAQVRIEAHGRVWVASGDYKREADPSCEPFESVRCDVFVTEATFGTPSYRWRRGEPIGAEIFRWWQRNRVAQKNSVVLAYSLGKSQRVLAELRNVTGGETVWVHPALADINRCYTAAGIDLGKTEILTLERLASPGGVPQGALIVAPPSVRDSEWVQQLGPSTLAFASGWAAGGSPFAPKEPGFVISDHADWGDLLRTIAESGAERVYVQHRGAGALVRHLRQLGLAADPVEALRPASAGPQLRLF